MATRTNRINRAPSGTDATPGSSDGTEQKPIESTPIVNDGSLSNGIGELESAVDPASAEPASEPVSGRKRRSDTGTRRGARSGNKRTAAKEENPQDIAFVLLSLHIMLANLMKVPELELTEEEAVKLATAVNRVNAAYSAIVIPEKVMVWINLAVTAGGIYGPRVFAYKARENKDGKTIPAESVN